MDQPQYYRKRPIVVQAIHYTGGNLDAVARFAGTAAKVAPARLPGPGRGVHEGIKITTLEGVMTASVGDWVIKGAAGEFYPCKDAIFAQTYEPAAEPGEAESPVIEIIERRRPGEITGQAAGIIVPNDVRINGQSLLASDDPITVHQMDFPATGAVKVTLTLYARRLVVQAEDVGADTPVPRPA